MPVKNLNEFTFTKYKVSYFKKMSTKILILLFSYTVHTIIGESGRCIFSWFCFAASDIVKWGDVKKLRRSISLWLVLLLVGLRATKLILFKCAVSVTYSKSL